jgi:hypothetical protein
MSDIDWKALEKAEKQAKTETSVVSQNTLSNERTKQRSKNQKPAEEELRDAVINAKASYSPGEVPRVLNSSERGQTVPVNTYLNRICVVLNNLKNKKK